MPYTPPSARSPTASRPTTPRSESFQKQNQQSLPSHGSSQHLPHSSSSKAYMSKHRRSPSISDLAGVPVGSLASDSTASQPKPSASHEDQHIASPTRTSRKPAFKEHESSSVPTESSPSQSPQQSSSDDEPNKRRGRMRDVANLAELQAAIRIIEQHRSGSPDVHASEQTKKARSALGLPGPRIETAQNLLSTDAGSMLPPQPPLSVGARKISHSRSSTETSAFLDFPRKKFDSPSRSMSDSEDDEEDLPVKPSLIRKKSGELVRPALRASSTRRRPSSMPGTPTYSKAVHFQEGSIEHVRHFLQVDRPIAVSAGSSPVDSSYEEDIEFPFSPPFDWEIRLTNFPHDPLRELSFPVKTEKVYLSADTKTLIGAVAVRNLAFHKLVVARFTLDYWKTTSEVVAEYNNDVRKKLTQDGYDRFTFNIKLEDQANLENKTMFFCIRYHVNGQDYWDNNNNLNYQIDFSKKFKPQNGKGGNRQLNSLPRSKPSPAHSNASPSMRPRSMPSFDDFASNMAPYEFSSFPHPSSMVGDSPIRFRNKPLANDIISDAPGKPKSSANQQAFGNRYDFGASLSAAIQASSIATGDKQFSPLRGNARALPNQSSQGADKAKYQHAPSAGIKVDSSEQGVPIGPKPIALTAEKPSLASPSYHELLDKYCFFGSGKATSPQSQPQPRALRSGITQADEPTEHKTSSEAPKTTREPMMQTKATTAPSTPSATTPVVEEQRSASNLASPHASRSTSPANPMGSRTASPGSFGYPYHAPLQNGLFDTHTPTAIRG